MSKLVVIENTVVRQDAFGRYCLNDIELEITLLRDDFALPRHALIDPVPAWAKDDIEADNWDCSASARPEKQINQDEVEDV